jgi:gas vesicle protein
MNDVMAESWKTGSVDGGKYAVALGEIAGGFALVGASIAGLPGAIIGGFIGLVVGFVDSLLQAKPQISELRKEAEALNAEVNKQKEIVDKDIESWNNLSNSTQENVEKQLSQARHISDLTDTLKDYIDENGRVQDSDKARVDFILNELNQAYGTNYKLIDGQITQNGKEVKSIDELTQGIQKLIDKKKAEAIINATADKYAEALLKRGQYYDEMIESTENMDRATEQLKSTFARYGIVLEDVNKESVEQAWHMLEGENLIKATGDGIAEMIDSYEKSEESMKKATSAWEDATDTIRETERLRTAVLEEDLEMTNKTLDEIENRYVKNGKTVRQTIENQVNQHIDAYKRQYNQLTEQEKQQQEQTLKRLASNLTEQTRKIEQMTPDMVKAWKNIAETSRETYDENISKIDEGTRLAIETSIGVVDTNSPDTIERWKKLAQDSESEYNRAIGLLPEDTRNAIGSATGVFYKEGKNFKDAGSYGGKQAAVGTNQSYYQSLDLKISGNNIKINPKGFDSIGNAISNLIQGNLGKFNIKFATKVEPIPNFATGGFPETGQLFVANEAGPELVGNIGRKTAVANQGQITEGIAEATYNAISRALSENKSSGGSTPYITVNVGNERLYSGYGKFQNEQSNMYGVTI